MPLEPVSPRFGVALGGGTARAFAHVGVLKSWLTLACRGRAVRHEFRRADRGALRALPRYRQTYALGGDVSGARGVGAWARLWPAPAAFVEGGRIEGWLERTIFHGATFADLQLPLHITCTDIHTGELVVLNRHSYHGSIARAVRASCALPGITRAFEIEGRLLIDGGFVSPVPVTPLLPEAQFILGVHTGIAVEQARSITRFRTFHASPAVSGGTGGF